MTQFSIEEYQKNPNRKVVTRDGAEVRIICTDANCSESRNIVALIKYVDEDYSLCRTFNNGGKYNDKADTVYDLFFAPREHWTNVFRVISTNEILTENRTYISKEAAISKWDNNYNDCELLNTILLYKEED